MPIIFIFAEQQQKMVSKIKLALSHVVFPLVVGSLIYIGFRSNNLKMFSWFDELSISNAIDVIRTGLMPCKTYLPDWIYYSFPDALWTYSFSAMLYLIWRELFIRYKILLMIPFCLLLIMEVFQDFKLIDGTFDFIDILSSLLMSLLLITNINFINYGKIN